MSMTRRGYLDSIHHICPQPNRHLTLYDIATRALAVQIFQTLYCASLSIKHLYIRPLLPHLNQKGNQEEVEIRVIFPSLPTLCFYFFSCTYPRCWNQLQMMENEDCHWDRRMIHPPTTHISELKNNIVLSSIYNEWGIPSSVWIGFNKYVRQFRSLLRYRF